MDDLDRPMVTRDRPTPADQLAGSSNSTKGNRGRQHGARTLATAAARVQLQELVATQLAKLPRWLDRVARERPDLAAALLLNACEFALPRLQRTEFTGEVVLTPDPDAERRELEAQLRQLGVDPGELLMRTMLTKKHEQAARTIEGETE